MFLERKAVKNGSTYPLLSGKNLIKVEAYPYPEDCSKCSFWHWAPHGWFQLVLKASLRQKADDKTTPRILLWRRKSVKWQVVFRKNFSLHNSFDVWLTMSCHLSAALGLSLLWEALQIKLLVETLTPGSCTVWFEPWKAAVKDKRPLEKTTGFHTPHCTATTLRCNRN